MTPCFVTNCSRGSSQGPVGGTRERRLHKRGQRHECRLLISLKILGGIFNAFLQGYMLVAATENPGERLVCSSVIVQRCASEAPCAAVVWGIPSSTHHQLPTLFLLSLSPSPLLFFPPFARCRVRFFGTISRAPASRITAPQRTTA